MESEDFFKQNKDVKYETVALSKLKPATYNPRKKLKPTDYVYQSLESSMRSFGLIDPIVVNSDYTIIAGHQRYNILKNNKVKEIGVIVVDLNKIDEKIANIALNKIAGEFEQEAIRHRLEELEELEQDIMRTGFSQAEYEAMELAASKGLENIFEEDNPEKEDQQDNKKTKLKIEYLTVAGYRVPITPEERDVFVSELEKYIEIFDSPIGFVTYLLKNVLGE